ncbi:MAG: hypothetical protein ACLS3Y_04380 [Collinsella sp.]
MSVAYTMGDKSVEGITNNTQRSPNARADARPGTPKTVTNIVKTVKGFLPTTGDQQVAALPHGVCNRHVRRRCPIWGIALGTLAEPGAKRPRAAGGINPDPTLHFSRHGVSLLRGGAFVRRGGGLATKPAHLLRLTVYSRPCRNV